MNNYGVVYAGAYGSNPDAANPNYDIPVYYLHASGDYPAMVCKVGGAGYGILIDGVGSGSAALVEIRREIALVD